MNPFRPRRFAVCALLMALVVLPRVAQGATDGLFATRLDATNIEQHKPRGPDAIAGIDDWVLGNGVVCAGIADGDHESMLSDRGGVLVDLGHCGRHDDQWGVFQPVMNLSRDEIVPIESVRAEIAEGEARIITTGRMHGARMETVYAVQPAPSRALTIRTTLEREGEGEAIFLLGDVAIHGNGQLAAFTLDTRQEGGSLGFVHPKAEISSVIDAADALVRADLQVLLGTRELKPEISYGWRLRDARVERQDGSREALAHLAMNGEHFSIIGIYTDTLNWGGTGTPNLLELAHLLWMDLEPGDRVVLEREILIGKKATVASITDQLWVQGPTVRGQVGARNATLHVFSEDDTPLTHLETAEDGSFAFQLPPGARGAHRIEVQTRTGDRDEIGFEVTADADAIQLPARKLPAPGRLRLPRGQTMRLTFIGLDSTPNPRIGADRRGFREGDREVRSHTESNHYSLVGTTADASELELAPGRYRVLASRGPLWSVSVRELEMRAGETTELEIKPPTQILDHPGWISADFHVHAAPSEDSGLPLERRLADFTAMGAQLIVSTEHDNVFDYAPVIESMGLGDQIQSMVGVEITSEQRGTETPYTAGHSNAFPIELDPHAYRGGAPRSQNRRLGRIAHDVHTRPGRPVLQLNHPREGTVDEGLGSYFSHLSVVGEPHDPTRTLDSPGNRALIERHEPEGSRDLDFDAIELLNGKSMERYRITRADWFAFLLQGEPRTATANSDSHKARETVALPVNYVFYPDEKKGQGDKRGALDTAALMDSVRRGRLYGSTGPLMEVSLEGQGPGQTFVGNQGTLDIQIRSTQWVPAEKLRVFLNGALASSHSLPQDGHLRLPLRFAQDSFVTVEVEGKALPGSIYAQIAPGHTPFAFTNPIFIDTEGDGTWTPPGLPDPLPTTLSDPLESP